MPDTTITLITGISGALVRDPERALWVAFPGKEVISAPGKKAFLLVNGYPDFRYADEPNSAVTITLMRQGVTQPILTLYANLHSLETRPYLITKVLP